LASIGLFRDIDQNKGAKLPLRSSYRYQVVSWSDTNDSYNILLLSLSNTNLLDPELNDIIGMKGITNNYETVIFVGSLRLYTACVSHWLYRLNTFSNVVSQAQCENVIIPVKAIVCPLAIESLIVLPAY